jgi:uncharacterized repeat protein (TIGR01451 family)
MHRSEAPNSMKSWTWRFLPQSVAGISRSTALKSVRWLGAHGAFAVVCAFSAFDAHAVGVPAGTSIDNTAQVTYSIGATNATTSSNTVSVTVAEILDVVVTLQTPSISVTGGATQQELVYRVTNTGNGPEAFSLVMTSVLGGDDFDPTAATPAIYFDTDASGDLSPGDTPYVIGTNDPNLSADAFVTVLVVNDIPAGVVDGNRGLSRLTAAARTGTGSPGTNFAGQGAGGTDAVVGTTGADGEASGQYLVSGVTVNAVKSQTVLDQFGGARPVPGARINYSIAVSATGTGTATGAVFTDDIPANTTYVPGTLRLNGAALTDGADVDAGDFSTTPAARVRVTLGNLTQASGSQTVEFAVTIN